MNTMIGKDVRLIDLERLKDFKEKLESVFQPVGNYLTEHQDISGKANVASPTFTGIPKAPTADTRTSTTQIATTQFVQQEIDRIVEEIHSTLPPIFDIDFTNGNVVLVEKDDATGHNFGIDSASGQMYIDYLIKIID